MEQKQQPNTLAETDDYDMLAAIWVLACVDDDPIITYEGLKYRLSFGTTDVDYIKGLAAKHPELFRRAMSDKRFKDWQCTMYSLAEEDRRDELPAWIRAIKGGKASWKKEIKKSTACDVFRSQLRTAMDSPPSHIDQINWGLQHIERIRTARVQARSELATKKQFYLILGVSVVNTVATIILALMTG